MNRTLAILLIAHVVSSVDAGHVTTYQAYETTEESLFDHASASRLHRAPEEREATAGTLPSEGTPSSQIRAQPSGGRISPAALCATIRRHVRYASDSGPEDQWKDAQLTWSSGVGDCEDFALCVKQRCAELGITAEIYRVYPADGQLGHVVVLGEWLGRTWMSSNGGYTEVKTHAEAVRLVAESMGWDHVDVEVVVGEPVARRVSAALEARPRAATTALQSRRGQAL
ncbi:MAG: hypothetical protein K8T26_18085 [Lentisphaerae bacterium]|nr:hypothetical protein [Lentisphaerota bacterium]